jgi:hypothetical protein
MGGNYGRTRSPNNFDGGRIYIRPQYLGKLLNFCQKFLGWDREIKTSGLAKQVGTERDGIRREILRRISRTQLKMHRSVLEWSYIRPPIFLINRRRCLVQQLHTSYVLGFFCVREMSSDCTARHTFLWVCVQVAAGKQLIYKFDRSW